MIKSTAAAPRCYLNTCLTRHQTNISKFVCWRLPCSIKPKLHNNYTLKPMYAYVLRWTYNLERISQKNIIYQREWICTHEHFIISIFSRNGHQQLKPSCHKTQTLSFLEFSQASTKMVWHIKKKSSIGSTKPLRSRISELKKTVLNFLLIIRIRNSKKKIISLGPGFHPTSMFYFIWRPLT